LRDGWRKSCKKRSQALLRTSRKRVRGAGRVTVKAEQLGGSQILLDLLVDLLTEDRGAADDDARRLAIASPASCQALSSVGFNATAK
jgi:hypothetical protein